METTSKLYKTILDIDLNDLHEFSDAIQKRHSIFHKNGFDVIGNEIIIENSEIISLANKVLKFIDNTEHKLAMKV
ncbi:MAG: hypothetical protein PHR48_03620 [Candidatus ainarchaeum sp.]|nr:hypothetical protein [Candidatus ainarchaeum sp.]